MEFIVLNHNFTNDLRTISYTIILSEDIYNSEYEFLKEYFLDKIFLCRTLEKGKVFSGSWEVVKMEQASIKLEHFSKGSTLFGFDSDCVIFLENIKELMKNKETKDSAKIIFNNMESNLKLFV